MKILLPIVAISAALCAAASAAQSVGPGKDAARVQAAQQVTTVPVVLASANDMRTPSPSADRPVAKPVRHLAPRMTTCRCGDPQPSQDPPAEDEPNE